MSLQKEPDGEACPCRGNPNVRSSLSQRSPKGDPLTLTTKLPQSLLFSPRHLALCSHPHVKPTGLSPASASGPWSCRPHHSFPTSSHSSWAKIWFPYFGTLPLSPFLLSLFLETVITRDLGAKKVKPGSLPESVGGREGGQSTKETLLRWVQGGRKTKFSEVYTSCPYHIC